MVAMMVEMTVALMVAMMVGMTVALMAEKLGDSTEIGMAGLTVVMMVAVMVE